MRVGRYQIRGISKRFWAVLALVIILPLLAYLLWPQSEPAPYVLDPAPNQLDQFFASSTSETLANAERLGGDDQWYEIGSKESEKQVLPGWDPLRWQNDMIETKVYVPSKEQIDEIALNRPSLVYEDPLGLEYYPAFVILPDRPLSPESRSSWPSDFAAPPGEEATPWIQLVSEEVLPTGEYSLRGLLYARSDALKKLSEAERESEYPNWIPTVLVAEAVEISAAEAEAPADRRAEINIPVQYGDYELTIKSLEWASGREVRLCVGWRNASLRPQIAFPDLGFFRLTVDTDDFTLVPRLEETGDNNFSSQAPLESGQPAEFSYWVVPSADLLPSDPQDIGIVFRIPGSGASIPVSKITVNSSDFQEPGLRDRYRWGGCSK